MQFLVPKGFGRDQTKRVCSLQSPLNWALSWDTARPANVPDLSVGRGCHYQRHEAAAETRCCRDALLHKTARQAGTTDSIANICSSASLSWKVATERVTPYLPPAAELSRLNMEKTLLSKQVEARSNGKPHPMQLKRPLHGHLKQRLSFTAGQGPARLSVRVHLFCKPRPLQTWEKRSVPECPAQGDAPKASSQCCGETALESQKYQGWKRPQDHPVQPSTYHHYFPLFPPTVIHYTSGKGHTTL